MPDAVPAAHVTGAGDHVHRHRPGSARAALSSADFRRMWLGSFASSIGMWMQNVVLPAYVFDRTGKASLVGLLVFAQLGPLLVLSIPGGVIADRFDRRRWLVSMQLVQAAFSVLLGVVTSFDASIAVLFAMALGVGIGNSLRAPAWSSILPSLVHRDDLSGAISLNSTMINGSRVVGPMLVAVLTAWGVTAAQIFMINGAMSVFVIAAILSVALPAPVISAERGLRQFTAGIRTARADRVVGVMLFGIFTFSLISLPYVGLFAAVADLNFGIDPQSPTYNWLYATWGLGACVGGLSISTVFVGIDKRKLVVWGFAAFAATLAGFALVRSPLPAFVIGFLLGAAYFGTTTSMLTVMQSRLDEATRGRVMALWFMGFGGTVAIGNLVFGPVVDAIGARWVMLGGALWAVVLARTCDVRRFEHGATSAPDPHERRDDDVANARSATAYDEHGVSAGD